MTLITTIAFDNFAVMASDTRQIWKEPGDLSVSYDDNGVKMAPLPRGVGFLGSGPSVQWADSQRERLSKGALSCSWAHAAMQDLQQNNPALAQYVQQHQRSLTIGAVDGELYAVSWDWAGNLKKSDLGSLGMLGPDSTFMDTDVLKMLLQKYQDALTALALSPGDFRPLLCTIARLTAVLYASVAQHTASVGPDLQMGVLIRGAGNRLLSLELPHTSYQCVLALDDASLSGWFLKPQDGDFSRRMRKVIRNLRRSALGVRS
jgi:hypothetical protein